MSTWKKLVYLRQPYPDNYTDISFLSQLKRNSTVVKHSYWKLVQDFSLIAQHIQCLLTVIIGFSAIYHHQWDPITVSGISSAASLGIFMVWADISRLKLVIVMIAILLVLSPVLKSLTKSTASDSIWAISFCLCIANTFFHEYALSSDVADCRPIISTNISFANAIVLASRLPSNISVFCFVLFAIEANILTTLFGIHVRQVYGLEAHKYLYMGTFLVVSCMVLTVLGSVATLIFVGTQMGIVLGLPGYFIFLQKYKNELQGPWDIAKLQAE